jgi:fluoride exporter
MVVLGGGLGAGFRFLIYTWVSKWYTATFPLATFLINVSGSFLIGLLMTLFLNRSSLNVNLRLFLVTGILGGYTTFSSFEWEIFLGLRGGAGAIALLYVVSSVVLGLAGVWLGAGICNYFWPNS